MSKSPMSVLMSTFRALPAGDPGRNGCTDLIRLSLIHEDGLGAENTHYSIDELNDSLGQRCSLDLTR